MNRKGYFSFFPRINYVSRTADRNTNDEFIEVINFFRRGKLREDVGRIATSFELYNIPGNIRPEQVAKQLYGNSAYDWIILLTNNIINVQDEWPMDDSTFKKYLQDKYGSDENLQKIHHYETSIFTDGFRRVIVPDGLIVDSDYNISALDTNNITSEKKFSSNLPIKRTTDVTVEQNGTVKNATGQQLIGNSVVAVSNYEYEVRINDAKRNILVLKTEYVSVVVDNLRDIMSYTESSQYINPNSKQGYNPRLTGI